jgi:hypothetical protein
MLVQTISQAIIATFFLLTLLAILCFWLFAGAAFASLFGAAGVAASSAPALPSLPSAPSVSARVVPPDPQLQAQEQARRALRDALNSSSAPSVPRYDYQAELRRIEQEQKWREQREADEKARREWAPNGPRRQ